MDMINEAGKGEKTGRIPDETIHCILEMYCHSSIYMTVKWVLGELECAPEGLAKILVDGMPGKLILVNLQCFD